MLQRGDTLDAHIHPANDSPYNKYLVVDTEQDYTAKISPSNRATPDGCVNSLSIPDMAIVIARPSYPPPTEPLLMDVSTV